MLNMYRIWCCSTLRQIFSRFFKKQILNLYWKNVLNAYKKYRMKTKTTLDMCKMKTKKERKKQRKLEQSELTSSYARAAALMVG